MSTRWTLEQLEAMIELDGGDQRILPPDDLPEPVRGCICPNAHQPNADGYIVSSPSCLLHGLRSTRIPMSRLTENSARTVGIVHARRGEG